jgi:ribosomal protein S12 methylthiotransferase
MRKTKRARSRAKVGMISLGCPKNLVDTEVLLGKAAEDYVICGDPEDADVVIVNTCAFIDQAREESLGAIREVARWKEEGKVRGLVVAGCMAQRYGDEIRKQVPAVDSILAMAEYAQVNRVLANVLDARAEAEAAQAPWRTLVAPDGKVPVIREETGRLRVTPRHYGYLRISEGCSNACTFCAIPNFRGLFRSKPAAVVLKEARELAASGAREINLISQDSTDYGRDLDGPSKERGLAHLLDELASVEGIRWIRVLYAYPGHVSDELIDTIARLSKPKKTGAVLVPYLDMPIQHISSRMLKRMGRRHTREETCELLTKLRARVPGLVLRTTFICGFPGETEKEHEELVEFVRHFEFERCGAFPYSHEKNTPAGEKFEDDISPEEKKRRADAIMAAQQPIAFAHGRAQIGKELEVIVEARAGDAEHLGKSDGVISVARSPWDAPEIDGVVFVESDSEIEPGTFVRAKVTRADGYDLVAEAVAIVGAPRRKTKAARKPRPGERRRLPIVRGD